MQRTLSAFALFHHPSATHESPFRSYNHSFHSVCAILYSTRNNFEYSSKQLENEKGFGFSTKLFFGSAESVREASEENSLILPRWDYNHWDCRWDYNNERTANPHSEKIIISKRAKKSDDDDCDDDEIKIMGKREAFFAFMNCWLLYFLQSSLLHHNAFTERNNNNNNGTAFSGCNTVNVLGIHYYYARVYNFWHSVAFFLSPV